MINEEKKFRKVNQKLFTLKLLPQKIHFKTFISKIHFKITPSKNAFQNFYFKNSLQNYSLKNAFQNSYPSSIVFLGMRKLLFFHKIF